MNFSRREQIQKLESKSEFDLLFIQGGIEVDTLDELYDEDLLNETY
jgi:hypothetical protein